MAQAARTPEAAAVLQGGRRLTYRELAGMSGRLAARLREAGIGPKATVGVCVGRVLELPVALLAVLRAGGAYVPLDPSLPRERLAFLLADSGARVILAQRELAGRLPAGPAHVIWIDGEANEPGESEPLPLPPIALAADNLAYLIYTSGSTGMPKAVAIRHGSAAALARWARSAYSDAELSGVLASTPIGFDLSVFELLVPLALGGQVVVAENILSLASLPEAPAVRLVNTVPSLMGELLRDGELPPAVTTVNLAGESLPGGLVRRSSVWARSGACSTSTVPRRIRPTRPALRSTAGACRPWGGRSTTPASMCWTGT